MVLSGTFILYAIGLFFILLILEKGYGYLRFRHPVRTMDVVSGLSSGMSNLLKDIFGLTVVIISYNWLYEHLKLTEIPSAIWVYAVTFIILDFAGYWWHRIMHRVNFFWNEHLVHHSSEEFDLACALRQPVANILSIFGLFLLPAAVIGVRPEIIAVIAPLHVFAQYWYHTRYIGKLGFLEKIIVTPSHHRVHHAQNPEYIDKNLSLIFIVWDKMFGTFQEELSHVPPVYGVTRPVATWNPIRINFSHLWLLTKDAWRAEKWQDKCSIWFRPTGWRPDGFAEKYPVDTIKDVHRFKKYHTEFSTMGKLYVWIQFFATLLLFVLFLLVIDTFTLNGAVTAGLLLFFSIFVYTEFMDKRHHFLILSLIRDVSGICVLLYTDFWLPITQLSSTMSFILLLYFIFSIVFSFILYFTEIRKTKWEPHYSSLS